jgi:hypothetical protein
MIGIRSKRLQRMVEKNWAEVEGIALRQYPSFVWSDRVKDLNEVPVFVFHDVTKDSLQNALRYLYDNGYATLTADEYVNQRGQGRGRDVMLTFDDGNRSLYETVYPLLKQFCLKAIAYIVPGRVPEDDGLDGPEEVRSLCSWGEIREMHDSEIVDFQCHSMFHHSVAISDQVVDFLRPGLDRSFTVSDLVPLIRSGGGTSESREIIYGTPIHEWGPRLGKARAFRESPAVVYACNQYVGRNGGASFFQSAGWHGRLKAVLARSRSRNPGGSFETEAEQRNAILRDFMESKCEIERRLPEKTIRHFAYPWFKGSALAIQLSAEAGYISNAWGSVLPNFTRRIQDPIPIARLSPCYIWRLPGKGRKPVWEILSTRWFNAIYNVVRRRVPL